MTNDSHKRSYLSRFGGQLLSILLLLGSCLLSSQAASLPASFSENKIADNLNPTTMVFAPDGRLFLCEKQGRIRVVKNGSMLSTPMLDISSNVDSWNERGLGGICVDPSFSSNGYIYVYYTAKSPSHNRVSRFTVSGDTASTGSEQVIFDITNLSSIGWHNGGGLRFGKDGKLYISTGENANGGNAKNTGNLLGKLLRINKEGSIPSDNPNYNSYSGNNRAIVALGLRNPFSLAVHPTSGLLYVNDVGAKYEEIERYDTNVNPVHVHYGWPDIDGPRGSQSAPSGYRDAAYAYDHGGGEGTALCGGDFYVPSNPGSGAFPSSYNGRFFFSDYRGWIKYIDPANPGTRHNFATNINRPIDVEIAPDGSLWYIARAGQGGGSDSDNTSTSNGSLWRVVYTGTGAATKLAYATQPASENAGDIIAPAVRVAVQDASGNTVTSSNAAITIAINNNPGSSTLRGTKTKNAVNGIATFDNLSLNNPGAGYTLRATSSGLSASNSNSFTINAVASAPTISPRSSTYSGPVWVQMHSATSGATIRYSTNGANPTGSSATYNGPFQITGTTTVKAFAQKSGLSNSSITTVNLTISGTKNYGVDYRPEVTGVNMPASNGSGVPSTLSGTGLFSNTGNLTAKPGVIPYDVNSPLWSDAAEKSRWVALPDSAKIGFAADGEYAWPGGTMLIKHFELVTNEQNNTKRRLETRVIVLDASGSNGYGVTYKWRSNNSDADLLTSGLDENITITGSNGQTRTQKWHYPSQAECLQCHTAVSGFVLGPKTRQLNGNHQYANGRTDNQIRTWNYLQMFTSNVNENNIGGYKKLVKVDDTSSSLENRARSYLDANCSFCHRPGGTGAQWDGRYDTPLAQQNILNGSVRETFGINGAKVVAPGDVVKSILHLRMNSLQATQRMPQIGSNVIDTKAVNTMAQWIGSLPPSTGGGNVVSGQVYYLTAKHSNKRLEIPPTGINTDGTDAVQWSARSGNDDNQQWRFDDMGSGWWKLTNVASGKALDVPGNSTANSVQLQHYRDNGGDNQRWSLSVTSDGFYTITSKRSNKNVDVDGASSADGAEIHQFQSTGNDNQKWSLTLVPNNGDLIDGGIYTLTAKHSGKVLDLFDDGNGSVNLDKTKIQQWPYYGGNNQKWRLNNMGNNWWRMTNIASGKMLDVPGGSTANSVALQQFRDNGGDNQRWSFTPTGEGWYKIGSKLSGKYLDVAGASTANGALIHQYQDNGADNQRWMLDMVAPAAIGWLYEDPLSGPFQRIFSSQLLGHQQRRLPYSTLSVSSP